MCVINIAISLYIIFICKYKVNITNIKISNMERIFPQIVRKERKKKTSIRTVYVYFSLTEFQFKTSHISTQRERAAASVSPDFLYIREYGCLCYRGSQCSLESNVSRDPYLLLVPLQSAPMQDLVVFFSRSIVVTSVRLGNSREFGVRPSSWRRSEIHYMLRFIGRLCFFHDRPCISRTRVERAPRGLNCGADYF